MILVSHCLLSLTNDSPGNWVVLLQFCSDFILFGIYTNLHVSDSEKIVTQLS